MRRQPEPQTDPAAACDERHQAAPLARGSGILPPRQEVSATNPALQVAAEFRTAATRRRHPASNAAEKKGWEKEGGNELAHHRALPTPRDRLAHDTICHALVGSGH